MYQLLGIDRFGKIYPICSNRKIDGIDCYTSTNRNKKELLNAVACTSLENFVDIKLVFIKPKTKESIELPIMYYFDIFKKDSVRYCLCEYFLKNREYLKYVIKHNHEENGTNRYNQLCQELLRSDLDHMSVETKSKFENFLNIYCRSYRKCRDAYFMLKSQGVAVFCENKKTKKDIISFDEEYVGFATDSVKIWECLSSFDLSLMNNEGLIEQLLYRFNMDVKYLADHLLGMSFDDTSRDDLFPSKYYKVYYPGYLEKKKKRQLTFFDIYGGITPKRK